MSVLVPPEGLYREAALRSIDRHLRGARPTILSGRLQLIAGSAWWLAITRCVRTHWWPVRHSAGGATVGGRTRHQSSGASEA